MIWYWSVSHVLCCFASIDVWIKLWHPKESLDLSLASSGYNDQHIFAMNATIDAKFFSTIIPNSEVSCLPYSKFMQSIFPICSQLFGARTVRRGDSGKNSKTTWTENDAKGMQLTWQIQIVGHCDDEYGMCIRVVLLCAVPSWKNRTYWLMRNLSRSIPL